MAERTINVRHQQKIDTATNWTTNNPTLLAGELGIESDTGLMKIGDGSTAWTSLAYFCDLTEIKANITANANNIESNANDIATKMDKANPTGTGSLSINRKENTTVGDYSVAVGYNTTASGSSSHAEGRTTTASGNSSHAEGISTAASGYYSHAEGWGTRASGRSSHTEGNYTEASGQYSHAEGNYTVANSKSQHVFGEYNVLDTSTDTTAKGTYVEIVGNGAMTIDDEGNASITRSNARTLDWSGNEVLAGGLITGGSVQVGASTLIQSDVNGGMEFGRTDGTAGTPYIDFHANATTTDYDARIIASDGSGSSTGTANLNAICKAFLINGGAITYDSSTDTFTI